MKWIGHLIAIVMAFVLSGAMCESDPALPAEEPSPSAAERLQSPRNLYDGPIHENLRELQQDLEEAGEQRLESQERAIDESTSP